MSEARRSSILGRLRLAIQQQQPISMYDSEYFCKVLLVTQNTPTTIAVHFHVEGSGRLGSLQDPSSSRLCIKSKNLTSITSMVLNQLARGEYTPTFKTGILLYETTYDDDDDDETDGQKTHLGDCCFEYGSSGYTKVAVPVVPHPCRLLMAFHRLGTVCPHGTVPALLWDQWFVVVGFLEPRAAVSLAVTCRGMYAPVMETVIPPLVAASVRALEGHPCLLDDALRDMCEGAADEALSEEQIERERSLAGTVFPTDEIRRGQYVMAFTPQDST